METDITAAIATVPSKTEFVATAAAVTAANNTAEALALEVAAASARDTFMKNKIIGIIQKYFVDQTATGCLDDMKINIAVFTEGERTALVTGLTGKGYHITVAENVLNICCMEM